MDPASFIQHLFEKAGGGWAAASVVAGTVIGALVGMALPLPMKKVCAGLGADIFTCARWIDQVDYAAWGPNLAKGAAAGALVGFVAAFLVKKFNSPST